MDPYQEDRLKRFKVFDHHAAHLLGAIRLCLEGGYIVPAMMLTFAGIDGMAWMYRTHEGARNGNDFKEWTDKFMIGHLKLGFVDSADFWAARNALLHIQSSYADSHLLGNAKAFLYIDARGQISFPAELTTQPIILTADAIVDRFEKAIEEFRGFINNSKRAELILDRCGQQA